MNCSYPPLSKPSNPPSYEIYAKYDEASVNTGPTDPRRIDREAAPQAAHQDRFEYPRRKVGFVYTHILCRNQCCQHHGEGIVDNWQLTDDIYETTSQRVRDFAKIVVAATPGLLYCSLLTLPGRVPDDQLSHILSWFLEISSSACRPRHLYLLMGIVGGMLYLIVGIVLLQLESDELALGTTRHGYGFESGRSPGADDRHASGAGYSLEWY